MILQEIFKYALQSGRFQIAHRMPGRLRLIVPDLARVPDEFESHIATARKLLERLPGMKSVSVNRMTGSMLFQYDASLVSETELLRWLERLMTDGLKIFGEFNSAKDVHAGLSSLQAHLGAVIERMRMRHAATEKN